MSIDLEVFRRQGLVQREDEQPPPQQQEVVSLFNGEVDSALRIYIYIVMVILAWEILKKL
jgi:hypothetical protein